MKLIFIAFCLFFILNWNVVNPNPVGGNPCPIGKNEIFLVMGPNCDRECSRLNEPCQKRGEPNRTGCFCRSGFARDSHGECVPTIFCDNGNELI
uniref:TIL domain-containing protein n=1 Tax=Musca domestica TaxID=7370 RepID=A0A1I8NK70_MUSDO